MWNVWANTLNWAFFTLRLTVSSLLICIFFLHCDSYEILSGFWNRLNYLFSIFFVIFVFRLSFCLSKHLLGYFMRKNYKIMWKNGERISEIFVSLVFMVDNHACSIKECLFAIWIFNYLFNLLRLCLDDDPYLT